MKLSALVSLLFLFSSSLFCQTPTGLTVRTATKQRVDLSWTGTASSYNVQRRVVGGTFASIATVSTTTASDTQIDATTTYQYQIVAASGSTTPSNQVTVGPPPAGFTVAAPSPGGAGTSLAENYGFNLSMVLDGNGDPAFAFLFQDPNQDTDYTDTRLLFRSWNRAQYQWNPMATVGVVGDTVSTFKSTVSLAYDASTNVFAIASEVNQSESVKLFTSADGGTTWSLKNTFHSDMDDTVGPSLALASGNLHLSFVRSGVGVQYVTGRLSTDPTTWQTKTAAKPAGTEPPDTGSSTSLALDSAGIPAVAFWAGDTNSSYNHVLLYWRPAAGTVPTRILDTQDQSGALAVKLTFFGLQPRVLLYAQRKDADFGVGVHFTRSQDAGVTWTTPVVIPPDGTSSTDYPFDLAIDSQGHGAIAMGRNGGSGDDQCGNPKLSLSSDLVTWRTCAAAPVAVTGAFSVYPSSLQLLYGGNDKLYLAWQEAAANPTGSGILLWREPPAGGTGNPVLDENSVHNGATDQPGIVAGSWAQVKGQTLSDVTRIWQDSDFADLIGNLPTALSGVSVKVNNLQAAVYYISPTQINFQVPSGVTAGTASVQVTRNGSVSNSVSGTSSANAPGLFGYSVNGKTYPAAVYANTFLVVGDPAVAGSSVRKAQAGDHIQLYATGLGTSPAGVIINAPSSLSGVTATIGGSSATVEFAGLVAVGEFQVNIVVPTLADGEYPVVIRYNGLNSQTGVVVPVGR